MDTSENSNSAAPPGMLEHPQYPGTFYDAGLIYIHTGDAAKDAAHRLMMMEHTYCIPQTFIIGEDHLG